MSLGKPCAVKSASVIVNRLDIVINRHLQRISLYPVKNELSLCLSLGCGYRLRIEVYANFKPCLGSSVKIGLELRVFHKRSCTAIATVAYSYDNKFHTAVFDLFPIYVALIIGNVNAIDL